MRRMLWLVLAAVLLLPSSIVRADVAPPPPPAGADVQPTVQTQVRMAAERVVIEAQPNEYGTPARAKVEAAFIMHNEGAQAETMQVRFPLNVLFAMYQADVNTCVFPVAFPEISDFRAEVNQRAVAVTNTVQRIKDPTGSAGAEKDVRCWANFQAAFPPGEDVRIVVRYSVEGYQPWGTPGQVQFPYVLLTGAAWHGTIGKAEIIFRAPFELNARTLVEYSPADGQVLGSEVRWLYQDFEPERNVSATIINPGLQARILREQAVLAKNDRDGEAWGRLGRWYKEAIRLNRGWRWGAGAEVMYVLSKEAYGKAVSRLPRDADWHAGFADLLCWNAWFNGVGGKVAQRDDLVACADQVRLALAINPRQAKAREILESLTYGAPAPVYINGDKTEYLILTQTPTAEPTERILPTGTPAPPAADTPVATAISVATATPVATATRLPSATPIIIAQYDMTQTAAAVNTAAVKPTDIVLTRAPEKSKGGGGGFCTTPLLFGAIGAALALAQYKKPG